MSARWLRIPALALLSLTLAAEGPSVSGSSTDPSKLLVFTDARNGLALTIEAEPAAADAGMFAFSVPGRGMYVSVTPATLSVHSPQSTNVAFSGMVDLVAENGARTRSAATMQAHLDPLHHFAEATLTTGQDRYHLVARAVNLGGLEDVLRRFERAILSGDHATLYEISSSEYTHSFSREAFIIAARAQAPALGTATKLRRLRIGDVQNTPLGLSFVVVPYEVTRTLNGATRIATEHMYFLYEGDVWRVWFGVAR